MALLVDSNLAVVPLLDERPLGYVFSQHAERSDTGYMFGSPTLVNSRAVTTMGFDGISPNAEPTTIDSARRVLNRFQAGARMRVYRRYPAVVTAWTGADDEGYSDLVVRDQGGTDRGWYASMRSFAFIINGLAVTS